MKSWSCITLQLPHRDIDLIIQNDYQMKLFLKFLVFSLRTINGTRDSGMPLFTTLMNQEKSRYLKKSGEFKIKSMVH